MHSARRISRSTVLGVGEARRRDAPLQPVLGDRRSSAARSGPSPRNSPRRPSIRCAGKRDRGDAQRRLLLGDQAPGEQHERSRAHRGRLGRRRRRALPRTARAAPSPSRAAPPRAGAAACSSREAERALGHARAEPLHERADAARRRRRGSRASSERLQTSNQSTTSSIAARAAAASAAASSEK